MNAATEVESQLHEKTLCVILLSWSELAPGQAAAGSTVEGPPQLHADSKVGWDRKNGRSI